MGPSTSSETNAPARSWATVADLILLAPVCWLAFLYRGGDLPINLWDEARVAVNAQEMLRPANLLVTTYRGFPDLWNTKPPLAIWLEAGSMRLFGGSEFALRLPSAIAAVATTVLVYAFTRHVSGSRVAGVLSALVLMGCAGYVGTHVARSADYDSLLVLFTTATTFAVWRALNDGPRISGVWLVVAALATALAILTKSVAGVMLLPGLALYVLWTGRARALLVNPAAWLCLPIAVAPPLAFYFAREAVEPGIWTAVVHNELGPRFVHVMGGIPRPPWYYLQELIMPWPWRPIWPYPATGSAFPWSALAPLALWATLTSRRSAVRQAGAMCALAIAVYLAIISVAATRVVWYAAPVYPLLAVLTALGAQRAWEGARFGLDRYRPGVRLGAALAVATLVVLGVVVRNARIVEAAPDLPETRSSAFVRSALADDPMLSHVRILHDGYGAPDGRPYTGPEDFYAARARARDVSVVQSDYRGLPGETLIWCDETVKRPVSARGDTVAAGHGCRAVRASR